MFIFCVASPHAILNQFQNAVLDKDNCDVVLGDSVFSKWAKIGIDALEGSLDGVLALIVHADADEHLDALEVIPAFFSLLRQFPQIVYQAVYWLEVTNFVFLGRVVVYDFCAIRSSDTWQVLTERGTSISNNQTLVEPRTTEDVERHERWVLNFRHFPNEITINSASVLLTLENKAVK